jgi:deoxyribonucleoside regulator
MSLSDDKRLLVEIASLYYEQSKTQEEIAQKMNISRSLVSKFLAKARNEGIIEFTINDKYAGPYRELEEQIKGKYGLEEVVCTESTDPNFQIKVLGIAAAKYLSRILKPTDVVAVSSGTTVHEAAENFSKQHQLPNVKFVPLVGGLGMEHITIQSNRVCELLAYNSGGRSVELHAPITLDDKEAKKILMKQSFIKKVLNEAEAADVALVGIGGTPIFSTLTNAYLSEQIDKDPEYSQAKIAGDICYNFIDHSGNVAKCAWNDRVVSIDLSKLKQIPCRIGVSGGNAKISGIKAVLAGQLINILITDEKTGRELARA